MLSEEIRHRAAALLSLDGKIALVTGAGSGIGREIALQMAQMGATVGILEKNAQSGAKTAESIRQSRGTAVPIVCDVTSDSDCQRVVNEAVAQFGRIDILCNNAGVTIRKDVVMLQENEWDEVLDVTLKSVYLLSRRVVPVMTCNGGGVIINIGSGWSLKAGPKAVAYCAAKAGVANLTRAMAIDHGKDNIRVNCVCPGTLTLLCWPASAASWEKILGFFCEKRQIVL